MKLNSISDFPLQIRSHDKLHSVLNGSEQMGAGLLEGNASVFLVFQSVISCGKHREQKKEENLLTMFDWVSVKHLEEYWLCYEKALT